MAENKEKDKLPIAAEVKLKKPKSKKAEYTREDMICMDVLRRKSIDTTMMQTYNPDGQRSLKEIIANIEKELGKLVWFQYPIIEDGMIDFTINNDYIVVGYRTGGKPCLIPSAFVPNIQEHIKIWEKGQALLLKQQQKKSIFTD